MRRLHQRQLVLVAHRARHVEQKHQVARRPLGPLDLLPLRPTRTSRCPPFHPLPVGEGGVRVLSAFCSSNRPRALRHFHVHRKRLSRPSAADSRTGNNSPAPRSAPHSAAATGPGQKPPHVRIRRRIDIDRKRRKRLLQWREKRIFDDGGVLFAGGAFAEHLAQPRLFKDGRSSFRISDFAKPIEIFQITFRNLNRGISEFDIHTFSCGLSAGRSYSLIARCCASLLSAIRCLASSPSLPNEKAIAVAFGSRFVSPGAGCPPDWLEADGANGLKPFIVTSLAASGTARANLPP